MVNTDVIKYESILPAVVGDASRMGVTRGADMQHIRNPN